MSYAFGTGRLARRVLWDLDLTVHRGEIVLLTGPSGSGKTTLLTLIGALRAVQHGSCAVLGHELNGITDAGRVAIRRRIGFIFQDHQLLDFLTARQNVAMALEHDPSSREADRMRRAADILIAVGLGHCLDLRPAQLSGGQRQRVAIARALVRNPDLLLADEPTAALDRQSGGEVMELVSELARERGLAVVVVTHDTRILGVADRILSMEDGQIGVAGTMP
ncbi:MAG TPA: ATP-binding cassette domain-containing protein [Acetobacteraceae bacterium]|nr:ATP-binding cassette domain-containing protein [Acetobacteraceae bacterium]